MQEMVIYGVSFDLVGKQPIVLLKTADGNKFLPIWIGHPEAAAILMKLQGANTPRPRWVVSYTCRCSRAGADASGARSSGRASRAAKIRPSAVNFPRMMFVARRIGIPV